VGAAPGVLAEASPPRSDIAKKRAGVCHVLRCMTDENVDRTGLCAAVRTMLPKRAASVTALTMGLGERRRNGLETKSGWCMS